MGDIDKKYEKNRRLSLYKRQKKMYNKMVCVLCCKEDGGKTKEEKPSDSQRRLLFKNFGFAENRSDLPI